MHRILKIQIDGMLLLSLITITMPSLVSAKPFPDAATDRGLPAGTSTFQYTTTECWGYVPTYASTKNVCEAGKENQDGLCYKPCREGYKGRGPVCWARGSSKSYGRGAGTVPSTAACDAGYTMFSVNTNQQECYQNCAHGYHFSDNNTCGNQHCSN